MDMCWLSHTSSWASKAWVKGLGSSAQGVEKIRWRDIGKGRPMGRPAYGWCQDLAFRLDINPRPRWPGLTLGCSDFCHQFLGFHQLLLDAGNVEYPQQMTVQPLHCQAEVGPPSVGDALALDLLH